MAKFVESGRSEVHRARFLRHPDLQGWLDEESVANDLKTIAMWRIMATSHDEAVLRDRLAQNYSNRTGEAPHFAADPIDVVVAILVAGYIAAIPANQHTIAGMLQFGFASNREQLADLQRSVERLSTVTDLVTRRAHTEHAQTELERILVVRAFFPDRSRSDVQILLRRLSSGDLAAADEETKRSARYWTARLCASDSETLDVAKELQVKISNDEPDRSLSIVNALICEMDGDSDGAIRLLRDHDDPDTRSVFFGLLVRKFGAEVALDEFEQGLASANGGYFTAIGWKNWAICMSEVGQWEDAAKRLASIDVTPSITPELALVEGTINAQLLLPDDRRSVSENPPIFAGISPRQGQHAEAVHARAVTCFNLDETVLREISDPTLDRLIADWRRWLRLMNPNGEDAGNARDELRKALERQNPDVTAMPFAWAFRVEFDPKRLRRFLSRRERLGDLSVDELCAECLIKLVDLDSGAIAGRDVLEYLELRQTRLVSVIQEGFLRTLRITALVDDNQVRRARALVEDATGDRSDFETRRLVAMIDAREGRDPRKELELAYQESGETVDLHNLIECLRQADDKEALRPLLEELFTRHQTVNNLLGLAKCLVERPFFDYFRVIQVLNANQDLVEQSTELKATKAWALFQVGSFSTARVLNEQLLDEPPFTNALALDIGISVASGDWERLPAIVEREWPRRDNHTAETLMSLAQIAAHQSRSPERALLLARLAADKAPNDPRILAASYWLYFLLGREDEADQNWLRRAFELSSDNEGPIWSTDLQTVATKWIPERQERLKEIEEKWLGGAIPTGVAAAMFNAPLTRLLVQIPEFNSAMVDRRASVLVPVIAGGRPAVALREDWCIGLDITSIMVLHYLDLLESVFDAFSRIKLAPDVMECLFREQERVRFHQPSRIRDSQQVSNLYSLQRIRLLDDLEAPTEEDVNEVGSEIAALLRAACRDGGKVVCVIPLHRPNTLMNEEANTTEWQDLIISVADFCKLLFERARIDAETHGRAKLFLRAQGQLVQHNAEGSVLAGTIYLEGLALSYLQSARVLDQIASTGLDLRIHPDVLGNMRELVRAGEYGDALAARIDRIRHVVRSAVESGRASYLPCKIDPNDKVRNRDDQFSTTQSLLAAASDCDALCVDDRYVNSNMQLAVTGDGERVLPIACVVDILDYLAEYGHINSERLWAVRHKLRLSGYVFTPFNADELAHWLKFSSNNGGQLIEGPELRAIRQSMVRSATAGFAKPAETFTWFSEVTQTCVATIRSLWRDESLNTESTAVVSDWIWRHLVLDVSGGHGKDETARRLAWYREATLRRIGIVLLPPWINSPSRRSRYSDWVDASVIQPLHQANATLIEEVAYFHMGFGRRSRN